MSRMMWRKQKLELNRTSQRFNFWRMWERESGALFSTKEQLGKPLPPQYALELLTVYAWEQGCKETGFNTAQGFQTVLKLVLKYQKLCIYWEKNYNSENPIIEEYLTKQLAKPRYSIRSCLSSPHKWTPAYSCCTLEMKELGGFHINWSSSDTYHAAGHSTSII